MYDLTLAGFSQNPKGIKKLYSISSIPKAILLKTDSPAKILSNRKKKMLFYLTTFETSTGAIKSVAEAGSAFALPISPLFSKSGTPRAVLISKMRNFIRFCKKFNANFFLCTLAEREIELRNARELIGFGELLGLTENEAREKMKILKSVIE